MFKAFNQIPNLSTGNIIKLIGADGHIYSYSVVSVKKATTTDGTTINLGDDQGKMLTLVTCDTLTGKSARFVVTAKFVE
jgi:LPXTG-site transpeptidase (sortase) family protein